MRTISKFVATLLIAVPVFASAQTVAELQAQAQALLLRVQELQQQLGTSGTGQTVGSAPYVDSSSCPLIGRILSLGSTGDDVTRLQQFLARDTSVYPERLITGYYGALTEAAVRRWQVKFNIVSTGNPQTTGYGQVGPRTAAAMSLQCSTSGGGGVAPSVGGYIRVTPITGNVPLTVSVEATVNTVNSCAGAVYTIEYGDNTAPSQIVLPAGRCTQLVQTLNHIYQYGGTFQVTLSSGAHRTSATVTVYGTGLSTPTSGTIADSVSANPTSGQAPLSVTFTGFINGSRSCGNGTYTIDFGDGQTVAVSYPDGCQAQSFSVTHQYTTGGTFNVRLFRGSQATGSIAALTSVSVSGTSVELNPFVVTPGINSNPLSVEVEFDIATPCSAYNLNWGDGTTHVIQSQGSSCTQVITTKTLGHTYTQTGSYTITLTRGSRTDTAAITIASF